MQFKELVSKIQQQFAVLANSNNLFRVNVSGSELWDLYLSSFKEHPLWRVNSVHNCDEDRHFIERYGNVVAIIDNKVVSMFDFDLEGEYKPSINALSDKIKSSQITSVFVETYDNLKSQGKANVRNSLTTNQSSYKLGVDKTIKIYTNEEEAKGKEINKAYTFYHFFVELPKQYVDFGSKSKESILGDLNTTRQLFEKTLSIPLETLELVRDLIQQGSLLRGDMYLDKVLNVIKLKKEFDKVSDKSNWLWLNFKSIPYARFANELIGTTCIELAEGKDINDVCRDFNYRVDPVNYNKAKAPITKQMFELAEKQIIELGYEQSFERRFAKLEDIDVSEVKHSNIDNSVEKPLGLFAKAGVPSTNQFNRHKRAEFDKLEQVTIDKFMSEILPNASGIEVFMENRFEGNLVSLFTAKDKTVKNLFKWSNPFSWTYNGNLSGKSQIKENVKAAGGKITGVLRCSLQWNDEDTKGHVDYDLHCESNNSHIYYGNKSCNYTKGWLDVDMIRPPKIGIENITWQTNLRDGVYRFYVKNFCGGQNTGFKVEIEFDGNVFNYHFNQSLSHKQDVNVATITVKNGVMSIEHHLPESSSSRNLWNLETNQFHKVNLVCTSPNHWGSNNIGTKEYFFMLQDCKTDNATRAFHVDQLNSELMSVRKAIDVLGNYKMVEPSDKQLSGVGFNSTVRDELIVKIKGSHQRVLKITF